EPGRDPRGVFHLLGRALPNALRLAVTPDPLGQDRLVARVDRIVTHRLPPEMVGDRPHAEPVPVQDVQSGPEIRLVLHRAPDVVMIAPAGDLQPVVAPLRRELRDLLEGQVRPLPGEQGDRSCHHATSHVVPAVSAFVPATSTHALPASALACTAATTRCTRSPSANDGSGSVPSAMEVSRSAAWCEKPCS